MPDTTQDTTDGRCHQTLSRRAACAVMLAGCTLPVWSAVPEAHPPELEHVDIGEGLRLHFVAKGRGRPVIFVHGSLSDYTYWDDQLEAFASSYHVIAYSRRHDFPNRNPILDGYSAVADAADLARLIRTLSLGKVHLIGHSYGALASLLLAVRNPELIRSMVLAEPPAVSLLGHLEGDDAAAGRNTLADIKANLVAPLTAKFRSGDREGGIRHFLTYMLKDPGAWDRLSARSKTETLRNAGEWDAILTRGTLFPEVVPEAIRRVALPTRLLSGGKSTPFLGMIDKELARLLPRSLRIVLPNGTHQMWYDDPAACRAVAIELFQQSA